MTICDKCKQACEPRVLLTGIYREPVRSQPVVQRDEIEHDLCESCEADYRAYVARFFEVKDA